MNRRADRPATAPTAHWQPAPVRPGQERARRARLFTIRILVLLTLLLGANYVVWRWLFSVNWDAWWIAVPLVVVETYW